MFIWHRGEKVVFIWHLGRLKEEGCVHGVLGREECSWGVGERRLCSWGVGERSLCSWGVGERRLCSLVVHQGCVHHFPGHGGKKKFVFMGRWGEKVVFIGGSSGLRSSLPGAWGKKEGCVHLACGRDGCVHGKFGDRDERRMPMYQ